MIHDNLIKGVQQSGLLITKPKLLDLIKKSTSGDFKISQIKNSKVIIVALTIS
jgi:hypothetical protein